MPNLRVQLPGLRFDNPFLIASGPPGTNAAVILRALEAGWGGVVCKTVLLDHTRIVNVAPRYCRWRADSGRIIGWENIELITDRPFSAWIDDFKRIKDRFPERPLIASIMEECARDAWHEIVERCDEAGVDAFELNLSCPHGLPEQRMGAAMGQDPPIVARIAGWVREATNKPVWAKMTPNITDIVAPSRAALEAGCDGVSAINTVLSVMRIDLDTLRPEPAVEGYSVPGGYSGEAIRPIALRAVAEIGTMMFGGGLGSAVDSPRPCEFRDRSLSAVGGVASGQDAAQFILLGAHTVQVCTAAMIHGYRLIERLCEELLGFMRRHRFESLDEFRGRSLAWFTTHAELVRLQHESTEADAASASARRAAPAG